MSGKAPFFITGCNAKLKLNGHTLAMATDLTYSVRVNHEAPHILGVYEAFTLEPMSYEVNGSFTVIRYVRDLKPFLKDQASAGSPDGTFDQGNGVGNWGPGGGFLNQWWQGVKSGTDNGTPRADQSFDPSKLHQPQMFDIEVYQKSKGGESGLFAKLRGCRLTGADFKLMRRGVAQQTFTFKACYADEDSFMAQFSGVGQTIV